MKKTYKVVDVKDSGFDAEYWASKTPKQRLDALETLRLQQLIINGTRQKFQRVFKLVDR